MAEAIWLDAAIKVLSLGIRKDPFQLCFKLYDGSDNQKFLGLFGDFTFKKPKVITTSLTYEAMQQIKYKFNKDMDGFCDMDGSKAFQVRIFTLLLSNCLHGVVWFWQYLVFFNEAHRGLSKCKYIRKL
jgi:hypothetical protein